MTNAANLEEIQYFASIISNAWRTSYPMTIEQVAAGIESELDGTQPADLIPQAVAMVVSRHSRNEA